MAKIQPHQIRNLALISHGGAGKTSVAEAILHYTGVTKRWGRVDDGNSILDHEPEEIGRQMSINTSIAPCEWKGTKINVLDTPGYFDFMGEVVAALRVVETAVVLVDAAAGVEVGTELVWRQADNLDLARVLLVNKMDRENADFEQVLQQLTVSFGDAVKPVHLPIGQAESFRGLVDLVQMKAFSFTDQGVEETEIPADMAGQVEEGREALLEVAAEQDDDLLEKYLEGEELTSEEINRGLSDAVREGSLFPVLVSAGLTGRGVHALLDFVKDMCPSPVAWGQVKGQDSDGSEVLLDPAQDSPTTALVFKTMTDPYVGKLTLFRVFSGTLEADSQVVNARTGGTERISQILVMAGKEQKSTDSVIAGDIGAVTKLGDTTTGDTLCSAQTVVSLAGFDFPTPIFSVAVEPRAKSDEEKIGVGLGRLTEEDPTFKVERNTETKQTIISGLGEMHLEVIRDRLKRKFGVEVDLTTPRIPYRETISRQIQSKHRHKKQTGGRGQYGEVYLELEPVDRGGGFEFVDKVVGGSVPRQYIPAVEKGVVEALEEGVIAGYPVTDVRVTLYDGTFHPVDSSEMAFKVAGSMAFRKGVSEAGPTLLEPVVNVQILVPEGYMGDVMGDLNKKRGRIQGMDNEGLFQVIRAQVPLAEMAKYAIDLRSITQGRATYTMEFSHYEEVPSQIADRIIAESKTEEE